MNKRQKKKQLKMRNKKLVEHYPFLLPRNVFTGKVPKDYDYTYTEYDCIYKGWQIGFGKLLLEDLREACLKTNFLDKLQFFQIKEKYGSLRLYTNGAPQEIHDVIRDYEFISQFICYQCGSPKATIVNDYGWYLPICECCWNKNNKNRASKGWKNLISWEEACEEEYVELPNEYKMYTYSNEGEKTITYDISNIVSKIKSRRNYSK